MKIAYCISAYADPQQLSRLVKSLNTKNSVFVIHIDKKKQFEAFQNGVARAW